VSNSGRVWETAEPRPGVLARQPSTSSALTQLSLPTDGASSHERSHSPSESSSIILLTPSPANRSLQLTQEPSMTTTPTSPPSQPLPPPQLTRPSDIEATRISKRDRSTSSLTSARLPTLQEDDHDGHSPHMRVPPIPSQKARPSSRPWTAPNPSSHHIAASDLQRHASMDSSLSSQSSTSAGESAPSPRKKPSWWKPSLPKRSRTSVSGNGEPATVPEKLPGPSAPSRSQTTPAVTSNVVDHPSPSRSSTSISTSISCLTSTRQWIPVSHEVLGFLERVASDPECWLRPAKDGTVSAGNLEGLLSRVIAGSVDASRDERFNAAFLTIYQLFATNEQVFEILKRRFELNALDPATLRSRYQ